MSAEAGIADGPGFRDRKVGLVVFGALEILMGVFLAFLAPMALAGALLQSSVNDGAGALPLSFTAASMLLYAALAAVFIWLGIGSILARRWARALWLVLSWVWLASGVLGLAFMLVFLPDLYDRMADAGQAPRAIFAVMKWITIGFMGVFYVLVPGAMTVFYGSRHVRATCEARDPRPRWTDRCPLPVLGLSLFSGVAAASLLMTGFYGWTVPFFGTILTGLSGAVVAVASAGLLAWSARGAYLLRRSAWWCLAGLFAAWGASALVTFSRVPLLDFYESMRFPPEQIEMMRSLQVFNGTGIVAFQALSLALALAYLLYTRRFFAAAARPAGA